MNFIPQKPKPLAFSIAAAVAITTGSTGALAQQRQLEEIVVTAERREATEQTTSISMEVFTSEDLTGRGIDNVQDLQNAMPSIQIQNNGVGNDVNIRGVGNSVFSPDVQMGVQIVNDGLVHGEPMGLAGAFFDVGTVEVLRGPQGTFIGQSAAGGAILINSADPDFDGVHGYIDGGIGNYQHNRIEGAVNLPINDSWAARVAFRTERRESYYENRGSRVFAHGEPQQNPGDLDNRQVRFNLLWQPNQQFDATFKVERNAYDHSGDARTPKLKPTTAFVDHDGSAATDPLEVTMWSQFREYTPHDPFVIHKLWAGEDYTQNTQFSFQMNYELDNGLLISTNTGHNKLFVKDEFWINQSGFTAVPIFPDRFQLGPDNRSWTNEITLASPEGRTNWIIGAFRQDRTTPVRFANPGGTPNDDCGWQIVTDPVTGAESVQHVTCGDFQMPSTFTHVLSPAEVTNEAIFGQYNWGFADDWQLEAGLRWNMDDGKRTTNVWVRGEGVGAPGSCEELGIYGGEFSGVTQFNDPTTHGCMQVVTNSVSSFDQPGVNVDQDVPTYKIGVNWTPTDNSYFYAFYARGYKAATHQGATGVEPEQIDDYEFGWKGDLFDGRLSGDLGFYYMDYEDMQGSAFVANDPLGSDSVNTNLGSAELMGIEGSFNWFIGNLGITGSFAFSSSEIENVRTVETASLPAYTEIDFGEFDFLPQCGLTGTLNDPADGFEADGVTPNGNCFNYEPYFVNLSGQDQINAPDASYNLAIDYLFQLPNGSFTPRLAYSHTDHSFGDIIQTDYYRMDERDLLDFTVDWESGPWNVQLYVRNLTNESYISSARGSVVGYGNPQTYGLRGRFTF